jgi:hypothetical protein
MTNSERAPCNSNCHWGSPFRPCEIYHKLTRPVASRITRTINCSCRSILTGPLNDNPRRLHKKLILGNVDSRTKEVLLTRTRPAALPLRCDLITMKEASKIFGHIASFIEHQDQRSPLDTNSTSCFTTALGPHHHERSLENIRAHRIIHRASQYSLHHMPPRPSRATELSGAQGCLC